MRVETYEIWYVTRSRKKQSESVTSIGTSSASYLYTNSTHYVGTSIFSITYTDYQSGEGKSYKYYTGNALRDYVNNKYETVAVGYYEANYSGMTWYRDCTSSSFYTNGTLSLGSITEYKTRSSTSDTSYGTRTTCDTYTSSS